MAATAAKGGLGEYRRALARALADPYPVYCFAGPERALRREGVAALQKAIGTAEFNCSRIEAEGGLGQALSLAATPPFFGGGNRLVLYAAPGLTAEEKKELAVYLTDPAPWSHLILSLDKGESSLLKGGLFIPCQRPDEGERLVWLSEKAGQLGFSLSRGALNLLASRTVGWDLERLGIEMEKLAAYAAGNSLEVGDVDLLLEANPQAKIFQLVDSLGERDIAGALRTLHRLLRGGEGALGILGMLSWQIRLLLEARGYLDLGLTEGEAARRLEGHPYVVRQTMKRVRRFTLDELRAGHGHLCQADRELKRGADPRLTLELTLLRFLGTNGPEQ